MAEKDDWRRQGQERYLLGARLTRRAWTETRPGWNHDHCAFCWATFAESDDPEVLREGYATEDEYHWICDACFADFRAEFNWTVAPSVTCPCCGYVTLTEAQAWEICPVCFWEDEPLRDPFVPTGGPNGRLSLYEAQQNYLATGVCKPNRAAYVRPPKADEARQPGWRPLPPPT